MGAGLAGDSVDFDLGNDHLFLACRQDCCPAANSVFALGNICCVFELCYLESESLRGTTPPQVMCTGPVKTDNDKIPPDVGK